MATKKTSSSKSSGYLTAVARPPQLDRRMLIAEAAYYLAESRGFAAGHSEEDWLSAEHQVDAALAKAEANATKPRAGRRQTADA